MAETLRGQLNSSFDRDGAKIGKCVPLPGGGYEEREFSTWAATWIAGIKKIPETVEDRSVVLRIKRKLPGEKVARFRGKDGGELSALRRKIARFVADNEQRLRDIEPDMPEALNAAGDRAPDAWEPLIAIADVAGGVWPQRARAAALALTGVDAAALADSDVEIELLSDIAQILNACDTFAPTAEQLKSNKSIAVEALEAVGRGGGQDGAHPPRRIVGLGGEQLTNALATFVERRWQTWDKGKPMRPHQLARLLRAYGAISQSLRDGATVFRGYPRDKLDDAIGRYLTPTPLHPWILRVTPLRAQKKLVKTRFLKTLQSMRVTL
jgi:putative DNA primase/helicase